MYKNVIKIKDLISVLKNEIVKTRDEQESAITEIIKGKLFDEVIKQVKLNPFNKFYVASIPLSELPKTSINCINNIKSNLENINSTFKAYHIEIGHFKIKSYASSKFLQVGFRILF